MYFAYGLPKTFNMGKVPNIKTSQSTVLLEIKYNVDFTLVATLTESSVSIWSGDQVCENVATITTVIISKMSNQLFKSIEY